ncbi:geranylgeranyl reductase family protein [Chlorobaculum sp. 24CR]|uniref:geranylgeranyl reductase family protein n=1 Tax=Chlorobaculum sp. 24CR TaxID=2508878 RepID=UPI00100BEBBB|nr:geranylgeranyl reductase family protein [Chlorobaculum sp. 24CR]RXK88393.1 geranylgeranyl reductase family protein [Chlorobaculum sp. 24CR]
MQRYDAVISGAGPAGCSAALSLSRKGYRVLLFDKARFPREKICGDGVTAASTELLEEMGVLELLRQRPGSLNAFTGATFVSPGGAVVQGRILQNGALQGGSYVIARTDLDECLVTRVKEHASITFLDNTEVTGLVMEGDRARGVRTSAGEFSGGVIIAADGAYSPIAKQLDLWNRDKRQQGFAMRAWFSGVEGLSDSIELCYDQAMLPGYGWIFPAGERRANVGVFLLPRFTDQRSTKRLFESFVKENAFAAARLKNAVMEPGTLKSWPLPFGSFAGRRGRGNVLLAGDAGSFIDPITGEGIYYALKTGRYAAEAVAHALERNDESAALSRYEQLWRGEFSTRVYFPGYVFQHFMNNAWFVDTFMRYTARKQHRADLLADVVAHNRKRRDLFKLLNPFY